jgi:hypothetical protein
VDYVSVNQLQKLVESAKLRLELRLLPMLLGFLSNITIEIRKQVVLV